MKTQALGSQETQSQKHTREVDKMKKLIATLSLTAVLTITAFSAQSVQLDQIAQDTRVTFSEYDKTLLIAGSGDKWDGG